MYKDSTLVVSQVSIRSCSCLKKLKPTDLAAQGTPALRKWRQWTESSRSSYSMSSRATWDTEDSVSKKQTETLNKSLVVHSLWAIHTHTCITHTHREKNCKHPYHGGCHHSSSHSINTYDELTIDPDRESEYQEYKGQKYLCHLTLGNLRASGHNKADEALTLI